MPRQPKPLDRDALMTYALRALAGRALSAGELREKLRRRAASPADVTPVVDKLKEAGYLDDSRFAQSYASARLENQGFGKMRVLRDLRQRRVAPGLAGRAVDEAFQNVDEVELVESFLRRKFRNQDLGALFADDSKLASAYRRLRQAGFTSGVSLRVLKRFARGTESLDSLEQQDVDQP